MPSPIDLDRSHWIKVAPVEGRKQVVKCLSFACYYSGNTFPPEVSTEGTELAANSTLTLEGTGQWFIAKKAASTEEQKPSLLEVQPATVESIGSSELAEGSVTTEKLATSAVTEPKLKNLSVVGSKAIPPSVPAVSATEGTVTVGAVAGVPRSVLVAWSSEKVANAKIKIKHTLATEYATVVAMFLLTSKKAKEQLPYAAWIKAVKVTSATELEVELEKEPAAAKEEYIFLVVG